MQLTPPTNAEARAGLRALKVILSADGHLSPVEERTLAATQAHILRTDIDVNTLTPISPAALAEAITRQEIREQLAGAFIIHSFASGEASAVQLEAIEAFTAALGVKPQELQDLKNYTRRRLVVLRYDVLRHMYIGKEVGRLWREEGVKGLLQTIGAFRGFHTDDALAAKYHALGELPEGTLGRAFFHHCRDNGFPFPGERYGAPEVMTLHDMAHVLGGYNTDPEGELQVAAFTAGFRREQSLSIMLFVLCQFDLGVRVAPVSGADAQVGLLNPDLFFAALRRGSEMTLDVFDGWDPWEVMDQPLEALRAEYNISPR